MSEKITGYILLLVGILLIIFASYTMYNTYVGRSDPATVITLNSISVDLTSFVPQDQRQLIDPNQIEVFSGKEVSLLANLTLHLVLMSFLVTVGAKISSLGVQLLHPLTVKLSSGEKNN